MQQINVKTDMLSPKINSKNYLDLKTFGAAANVAAVINVPKIRRK